MLEENTGINLRDLGLVNGFSDTPPKRQGKEKEITGPHKNGAQNFYASKDTVRKVKREFTE